jgi:predicted DNA-binding ribbon-helix-helix protein
MQYNEKLKQKLKSDVQALPQKVTSLTLDEAMHTALKTKASSQQMSIKEVLVKLINDYLNDNNK